MTLQSHRPAENVMFIDSLVKESEFFSSSTNESTFPIIYSTTTSTKTEILSLLRNTFTSIERIGIAFTFRRENYFLDGSPFFYSSGMIDIIKEFNVKKIDFLACGTLNSPDWVQHYSILERETGVVVGASNDKTGNLKYGSDWVMEITRQNIETIYFSESIVEYYKYLLDDEVWTSVGVEVGPTHTIAHEGFLYVTLFLQYPVRIAKISLTNPSFYMNQSWAVFDVAEEERGTNGGSGGGLAIHNGYIYVGIRHNIVKIDLLHPENINYTWTTAREDFFCYIDDIKIHEGYIYYSNWVQITDVMEGDINTFDTIGRVSLTNPESDHNRFWSIGSEQAGYQGLTIWNGYLYVTRFQDNAIDKISLTDPAGDYYKPWTTT